MVAIIRSFFFVALAVSVSAFAPSQQSVSISQKSSSHLQMGLFDFFSEEAKADRKAADEKRKEEEEEGYQKMMQRRLNPEVMEEYEKKVVVRRENYKRMKTTLEKTQENIYIDEEEEK